MDKKLFPDAPDELSALSTDEVKQLLEESEKAVELIVSDDSEFLAGLSADEVIEQMEPGVAFVKTLRAELAERDAAHANYKEKTAALAEGLAMADDDSSDEDESGDEAKETETEEVTAEADVEEVEPVEETETVEERELEPVVASTSSVVRYSRTPPAPAPNREPTETETEQGATLVASSQWRESYRQALDPNSLAELAREAATDLGPLAHTDQPGRYFTDVHFGETHVYSDGRRERTGHDAKVIWDGPKTKIARAEFEFPEERTLNGSDGDVAKILSVLPETVMFAGQKGGVTGPALVAAGGLCAPLTPIYSMPNFATDAEPVWDSLPVFRAARGGLNTPAATTIADITSAISSISEANDALGGTFATKSCQDLDCPDYTEVAVQILAHCREYGNLNARAWPEKIAHENALTMAALSRTSEGFMLDRIKALSVNVTNGAETLGALIYLVDAITKGVWGIRGRLRMAAGSRFRALLPIATLDILILDAIQNQFDRYKTRGDVDAYLRSIGVDPVYYLDTPSTGTTQLPDASQTAAAIDPFPDNIQWALYPEGAFLGIDSGSLELGIVRDSVLNSTNDFQVFGERFRNLTRIGPAQSAYWVTSDICANGQFPPAGTARTCD